MKWNAMSRIQKSLLLAGFELGEGPARRAVPREKLVQRANAISQSCPTDADLEKFRQELIQRFPEA